MSTPEPDDFELHLSRLLHSRDSRPAGFTAAQVVAGGRRRRRSRAVAASGLALVAVVAVLGVGAGPAGLAGGSGKGRDGDNPAATPAATKAARPAAPFSAAPAGAPRTLASPGTVDIGGGFRLAVTTNSIELLDPGTGPGSGSVGPDFVEPKGPDTTSMMISGRAVASLYSGTHHVASAVVTVGGRAYPATILRMAGRTDWSAAYVVLPDDGAASGSPLITVFDAAGRPLASGPPSPGVPS